CSAMRKCGTRYSSTSSVSTERPGGRWLQLKRNPHHSRLWSSEAGEGEAPSPEAQTALGCISQTSFMMGAQLMAGKDRHVRFENPAHLTCWYHSWYDLGAWAESPIITMRTQTH